MASAMIVFYALGVSIAFASPYNDVTSPPCINVGARRAQRFHSTHQGYPLRSLAERSHYTMKIRVKCHYCGHEWEEDLARYEQVREINRDWRFWRRQGGNRNASPPPQRPQRYRFTCPNDGKRVVVEV